MSFLAEKVLSHFQTASAKKIKIGKEKRYSKPQSFQFSYPLNPEETEKESYQIALSWLVCAVSDSQEVLALSLMEQILLGSLAAPLRYKLIESNLGKDLGDTTGYHSDYSETFFSVGLKGVSSLAAVAICGKVLGDGSFRFLRYFLLDLIFLLFHIVFTGVQFYPHSVRVVYKVFLN